MRGKKLREELKYNLGLLTDKNRAIFMYMYSPTDQHKDINKVVDEMPYKRLKWALQQALNTKHNLFTKLRTNYE